MKTKTEHSAGLVVFKKENNKIFFLLGKHSGYHKWVLPKGLIEKGETPQEAAIRETQEEMAVKAKITKTETLYTENYSYQADYKNSSENSPEAPENTRRVLKYQEQGGNKYLIKKTVDFFLAEYISGDPQNHGWEMEAADWFDFYKALEKITFSGEKNALIKAQKLLQITKS